MVSGSVTVIRKISDPTGKSSATFLTKEVLEKMGGVSFSSLTLITTYQKKDMINKNKSTSCDAEIETN